MINRQTIRKILLGVTALYLTGVVGLALYHTLQRVQGTEEAPPDSQSAPSPPPLLEAGVLAPDFSLPAVDGKTIRLQDYRQQKHVLIEFFASWCPHCQQSVTLLKGLHQRYSGKLQILAINAGDKPPHASTSKAFQEAFQIAYPILENPTPEMLSEYHLTGFPTFYLVDPSGKIRWAHAGALDDTVISDLTHHLNK